jgi:hypothetical protein
MQQDGSSELARQAPGVQSDLIQTHLDTESVCPEVLVEAILSQVLILTPQVPHCNYKYVHADTFFTRKNQQKSQKRFYLRLCSIRNLCAVLIAEPQAELAPRAKVGSAHCADVELPTRDLAKGRLVAPHLELLCPLQTLSRQGASGPGAHAHSGQ